MPRPAKFPLRVGEWNITNGLETIDVLDDDNRVIGHFYRDDTTLKQLKFILNAANVAHAKGLEQCQDIKYPARS